MGARDAELAVEDEGRHRRNPEPAHLFFQCGDFLRVSLLRPARNPAALRNLLQHFRIADVLGLFEVGAEKVLDHRLAGALALSELDQAVRSEGARRARHALERELDALAASFRGDAGVELAAPLDRAEFRLAVLRARHPALQHLGVQLEGQVANAHLRFVAQKHERLFKAPLPDVAPRANDVGNHLDAQRLSHYRFLAGIVQREIVRPLSSTFLSGLHLPMSNWRETMRDPGLSCSISRGISFTLRSRSRESVTTVASGQSALDRSLLR